MKLLALLALLIFASIAEGATTYWVSTSGNDSNGCATASGSTPLTTQALRNVSTGVGCMTDMQGDTVVIRAGTYNENITSAERFIPSGSSYSNASTVRAHTGETVTLNGNISLEHVAYFIVQDLIITNGVWAGTTTGSNNSHHIKWINLNVSGNGQVASGGADFMEFLGGSYHDAPSCSPNCHAMYILGDDVLIDGVKAYGSGGGGYGVHAYTGATGKPNRITVRNSEIYS